MSGIIWVATTGTTEVTVSDRPVRLATATGITTTTAASEDLFTFSAPSDEASALQVITVHSADDEEPLAGALMVRSGYVVTSGAALAGAEDVVVTWGDEREAGKVIGHDALTDVSVIRVDGPTPESTDHVEDGRAREGDEVKMSTDDGDTSLRVVAAESTSAMANGDPMVGVVELDGRIGDIPPGSPAYDAGGAVIGIATATADDAPAALVPISLAREVAAEIIDHGEAIHPWLGVTARDLTADDQFDRSGSLLTAVADAGPAAAAGMLAGDLIVHMDDRAISSMAAMVATLRSHEPGDVVDIVVWRAGEEVALAVTLVSHLDADA